MKVTVRYNWVPIAPRKIRYVLDGIKGKRVSEAIALMGATPRPTAQPVKKLLLSSVSAARDRMPNLDAEKLLVAEIYCNEGPRLYRTFYKARGRAHRFAKRSSHLTLTVTDSAIAKTNKVAKLEKPVKENQGAQKVIAKTREVKTSKTNKIKKSRRSGIPPTAATNS